MLFQREVMKNEGNKEEDLSTAQKNIEHAAKKIRHRVRSHFGSRAISVQVNIVAISDHMFHRFLFDLLTQVSATQLSLFFVHPIRFDGYPSRVVWRCSACHLAWFADAVIFKCWFSFRFYSWPWENGEPPHHDGGKINEIYVLLPLFLQNASRRFPRQWSLVMQKSQILNILLAALQPVLPLWKRMQLPHQAVPARQEIGSYLDMVMAPQPLGLSGPMAQHHLTTTEQDVDLILSQAPKMNVHEVPSYYGCHVNSTTLEFPRGSISSWKSPTYQPTTNPLGFIAKQVAYPPDSHSRRELNVSTLWLDTRMMVSLRSW